MAGQEKRAQSKRREQQKKLERGRERERERARWKKKKNGQKLLMMASSSSDPGTWLIKPSYGMDGGWIGQRGCWLCSGGNVARGGGRGWKSGQKFFFRFCFRAAAISQKTKTQWKGQGHGFWGRWTSKLFPKYPEVIINVLRPYKPPPTLTASPPHGLSIIMTGSRTFGHKCSIIPLLIARN